MPPSNSLDLEQRIIDVFRECKTFNFNGVNYVVDIIGKPRPSIGECKTDVYVHAHDNTRRSSLELKISVKDESTNEFQANKLTANDASNIFGKDWANIISRASKSIRKEFEKRPLIFAKRKNPTQANSITLGWKLEIASKGRKLSAKIPLEIQEIRDYVFKGTQLDNDKKNAKVDNQMIINSGVADYILLANINNINTTNDIISKLKPINNYNPPEIYLIFTANNYRTRDDKTDGNRSLAVQIEWVCENGKLTPKFKYDNPLKKTGQDMKSILLKALSSLGKRHPEEMNEQDISDKKYFYS